MSDAKARPLFMVGALLVTVFGFLSASIEGLAHTTQWIRFYPYSGPYYLPISSYVDYYPLNFSVHAATGIFTVCVIGGLLGLLYLFAPKRTMLAFTSLLVTSIGLLLPITITRTIIPETQYFETPWIGSYIILAGFSLMLLSLTPKSRIRQIAIPIALALLAINAAYPLFVATTSLPYIIYGATFFPIYPIVGACSFTCIFAMLVTFAFTFKNQIVSWISEKEIKKGKT